MSPRDEDDKNDLDEFGIGGATRTNAPAPSSRAKGAHDLVRFPVGSDEDILGDLSSMKGSAAFQAALARRLAASAPVVQKIVKRPTLTLAFGPATVPAGSSVTFSQKPDRPFVGQKQICTHDTDDLLIDSMFVGNKNQFPLGVRDIPADSFHRNSLSNGVRLDRCEAGENIYISVRNTGSIPRTFGMYVFGVETLPR
jgi:hypothetical protein